MGFTSTGSGQWLDDCQRLCAQRLCFSATPCTTLRIIRSVSENSIKFASSCSRFRYTIQEHSIASSSSAPDASRCVQSRPQPRPVRRSRGAALPLVFSWSFRGCAASLSWEFVPDLNLVLVLVLRGAAAPVLNLNLVLVLVLVLTPPTPPSPPANLPKSAP